jgi:hypothetical protein
MLAASALLLGLAAPAPADVVLFTQPSDFPVSGRVGAWASQFDTGTPSLGNFATAYDNFSVMGTGSFQVNSLTWQGGYFAPPTQGPITQFTLQFWSDAGGKPGSVLATETIPGNANETFVGTEPASGALGPDLVFNYSTNLPTPFVGTAGTQYWLSIVPDLDFSSSNFGQWGWHTATGGDGTSLQDFFGTRFTNPNDLAFTLIGLSPAQIPEPTSMLVWGALGVAGLVGYRARKRKLAA